MTPARATSLVTPVLAVLLVLFIVSNAYRFVMGDEYEDDDDTITVTFNCTQVLGNQNNYPDFVIQQCKQLRANE